MFKELFITKTEIKPTKTKVVLKEDESIFWNCKKDNNGLAIRDTIKWCIFKPTDYDLNIISGPSNIVRGSSISVGNLNYDQYDESILKYLVKVEDVDKVDTYIVIYQQEAYYSTSMGKVEYRTNYDYGHASLVKNTDNYFQVISKSPKYKIIKTQKGKYNDAIIISREEAEKILYKKDEDILLNTYEYAQLLHVGENIFRIKCLDVNEVYDITTYKRFTEFKADLKKYNLTISSEYFKIK